MENEHTYTNIYAYNSQERVDRIAGEIIGSYNNANYTMDNMNFSVYASTSDV